MSIYLALILLPVLAFTVGGAPRSVKFSRSTEKAIGEALELIEPCHE